MQAENVYILGGNVSFLGDNVNNVVIWVIVVKLVSASILKCHGSYVKQPMWYEHADWVTERL